MQTSQDLTWLQAARGTGILSKLSDSMLESVLKSSHRVEYAAGAIALRWDESPRAAIVVRGAMRGFIMFPDGTQATTRYLKPGDMTGVFAARSPRIAKAVQAIEPSELLFVDAGRIKELALAEPSFAWTLIEELTTVLNSAHRALYIRAFGSVRQRVACAILERAEISGCLEKGSRLEGTQVELASAVGSVREVVASALHALKREGILDISRGGVVVLDPARLAVEANLGLAAGLES
ncbi:MAG TPA: Crp/Fnr family transcriptional regulator [Candidatus Dormibacteraeota bacterium]|nr:Crp/Fnr family transcriptional regulator [Candidatus Dormibacteraeota bacterium]